MLSMGAHIGSWLSGRNFYQDYVNYRPPPMVMAIVSNPTPIATTFLCRKCKRGRPSALKRIGLGECESINPACRKCHREPPSPKPKGRCHSQWQRRKQLNIMLASRAYTYQIQRKISVLSTHETSPSFSPISSRGTVLDLEDLTNMYLYLSWVVSTHIFLWIR